MYFKNSKTNTIYKQGQTDGGFVFFYFVQVAAYQDGTFIHSRGMFKLEAQLAEAVKQEYEPATAQEYETLIVDYLAAEQTTRLHFLAKLEKRYQQKAAADAAYKAKQERRAA